MRKFAWFACGFIAGVFPCAAFYGAWIFPAAIAALVITAIVAIISKVREKGRRTVLACFGCALGLLWFLLYDEIFVLVPRVADGHAGYVTIEASNYSTETDNGVAVEGYVTLAQRSYRVKAYLQQSVELKPGDCISGYFRFRLTTTGGIHNATNHQAEGIFLLAYSVSNEEITYADEIPLCYYPSLWQHSLLNRIKEIFPQNAGAFASALLLGDRSDITYEMNTAFKVSGISHIIAVSGLHVSILFGLIFLLTGKKRRITCILGIPVLMLFAAVAAFTPSITRACIMQSLMLIAMATDREYDSKTALAFAVFVMLVANPMVVLSVSLQLSAGSVLGILLFSERIQRRLLNENKKRKKSISRLLHWVVSSISVTLGAMVITTPLVAYYFGTVSLVGLITNLLTIWIISFIFYGIILCMVVSLISTVLAGWLAFVYSVPICFVLQNAMFLSKLPMAAVYTVSIYVVVWLVGIYVLLAVFLLLKKKRPVLFASCVVLTLMLAVIFSWAEPMLDRCRVTVLDVGQGQCILLQSGGKTFVVDCGGDDGEIAANLAAETLLSQGIKRVDGIIVTHFDDDHAGGIPYLLTRIQTDRLILPYVLDEDNVAQSILSLTDGAVQYIQQDICYSYDDTKLTVIAPISYNLGNESSLCVLFQCGNYDILIMGDRGELGETVLLATHQLPELELLIVGHHGSKTSTGDGLLEATRPQCAIISVGRNNRYGHPSDKVLERLAQIGCPVYRTDLYGTIIFRR